MEQQKHRKIAVYDTPISMPTEDIPQEFVRMVESRFVTKRFPKTQEAQARARASKQENN